MNIVFFVSVSYIVFMCVVYGMMFMCFVFVRHGAKYFGTCT